MARRLRYTCRMFVEPRSWPRDRYEATDNEARLLYYVFGKFPAEIAPSRSTYRIGSNPPALQVSSHRATEPRTRAVVQQPLFARALAQSSSALRKAVDRAPSCLLVHGEFLDPPTLDYLRDTVGLLAYLADNGAVAILDAFRLKWWAPAEFKREVFEPNAPVPLEHTLLIGSEGPEGLWIHTRGMGKFARPDLSVRGVPPKLREPVIELVSRLVERMAEGEVIPEDEAIILPSLPAGMRCRHQGNLEDPEFHNTHVEITWPPGLGS